MTHPQLLEGLKEESQAEDNGKREGVEAHSLTRNSRRVEGRAGAPGLGLGRVTSLIHLLEPASKPTAKWLVHIPKHLGARTSPGNMDSLDSSRPGLGGSHHLPPYSILCASSRHLHPNGFLSQDSQGRVSKLSRFGLLGL
jgi:hypothetical protein